MAKVGILALGPATLHPDHLAPSLVAVHRLLAVGEAFCGDDSRQLRGALAAAAAEALPQAHAAALQRHASALARDPWRRADVTAAGGLEHCSTHLVSSNQFMYKCRTKDALPSGLCPQHAPLPEDPHPTYPCAPVCSENHVAYIEIVLGPAPCFTKLDGQVDEE